MAAPSKKLDTLALAFLDAIAVGETYDSNDYNELVGGDHFTSFDSFPQWSGRRFPTGISHAAGRYQFQPATWASVAKSARLADFSPQSQDVGAWWLAQSDYQRRTGRDLRADLTAKRFDRLVTGLRPTWASINDRTAPRFEGALAARRRLAL